MLNLADILRTTPTPDTPRSDEEVLAVLQSLKRQFRVEPLPRIQPAPFTLTIGNGHEVVGEPLLDDYYRSGKGVRYRLHFPESLRREIAKTREFNRMWNSCDGMRRRQLRRRRK